MRIDDIERLAKVHASLIADSTEFRDSQGNPHYNFSDTHKAISAVAKAIADAVSNNPQ